MIVTSQIINRLATALKTVIPETEDNNMTIRDVDFVLQAQEPYRVDGLTGGTAVVNTSMCREQYFIQTNAAGAVAALITLGLGIWDITLTSYFACNYTSTSATPDADIRMIGSGGAGNQCKLHSYMAQGLAGVPVTASLSSKFNLTIDDPLGMRFSLGSLTNGAGETMRLCASIVANKIL